MPYNPLSLRGAEVPLPTIDPRRHPRLVTLKSDPSSTVLDYPHHSVIMNKDRRLAIYSACNIDGSSIADINRKGNFKEEDRIETHEQIGQTFYDRCSKVIDRGHLTKFEDVIWGAGLTDEAYLDLGKSTNFFPNIVPQHKSMNRGMWSSLELYILDNEAEENDLKICMFTGPILDKKDPWFKYEIGGKKLQLPFHFWKIVVYKKNNNLYAIGFMMSHKQLLDAENLLERKKLSLYEIATKSLYFSDFKHSKPYQVQVELIEAFAGIKLQASIPLVKPYKDDRPTELVFKEIEVRTKSMLEATMKGRKVRSPFNITNMVTE